MADRADVVPPPDVPDWAAGLVSQVDALQQRVAVLEVVLGRVTPQTALDVPELAASSLGTNPASLSAYTEEAKRQRAEERARNG